MSETTIQEYRHHTGTCWSASCFKDASRRLKARVVDRFHLDSFPFGFEMHIDYCEPCAKEFAYWLVFQYDHHYEILDISVIGGSDG